MNLHDTYLYIFICIGVIIANLFVVYKYYNKTREGFNFEKIIASATKGILTGMSYIMPGGIGKFFRDNLKKSKKKSQHLIANFGFSGLKLIFLSVFIMIVIVTLPISIPVLFMVISFILSIIFGIFSFLISIIVFLCSPVIGVGAAPVVAAAKAGNTAFGTVADMAAKAGNTAVADMAAVAGPAAAAAAATKAVTGLPAAKAVAGPAAAVADMAAKAVTGPAAAVAGPAAAKVATTDVV